MTGFLIAEDNGRTDEAITVGDHVESGEPGTEDYDTGIVHEITATGARIGWDSGVETVQPLDLLRRLS